MKLSVCKYSGFKVYFVLLDEFNSITRGSVLTSVAEDTKAALVSSMMHTNRANNAFFVNFSSGFLLFVVVVLFIRHRSDYLIFTLFTALYDE